MKRYSLVIACALALTLLCASATLAVFPKPDGYAFVPLQLGWFDDIQAWYICTSTTNVTIATTTGQVFTPKLLSGIEGPTLAARPYYIVANFNNPPVFSTAPGQPDYSSIWQAFIITWKTGFARPITNADPASPMNPNGLPPAEEADIVATNQVDRCPIFALGPLGGPWYCVPPGGYRIPQGMTGVFLSVWTQSAKQIYPLLMNPRIVIIPAWLVNCQEPCTKRTSIGAAVITDTSDPALAAQIGANLAPGLLNMPEADTMRFWVFSGMQPPYQYPVVEDCPVFCHIPPPPADDATSNQNSNGNFINPLNKNYNYSCVMRYITLARNLPPWVVVSTTQQLLFLMDMGLLVPTGESRIGGDIFSIMNY